MVGYIQLFILFFVWGCAHMQPDPHFWPGTSHQLKRVPATEISNEVLAKAPVYTKPPSLSRSEWKLIRKESFSHRLYRLTVKDQDGNLMDSAVPPEMILEGEANLSWIKRVSPGAWDVKLELTTEQSVIKVGFVIGGQRVEHFKQIHFQIHEVDVLNSQSFTYKKRIRSDGEDALRIYVSIKDMRGYTIYSSEDFDLRVKTNRPFVKVEGPFSGHTGPYFKIRSKQATHLKYFVTLDGDRLTGDGEANFVLSDARRPAEENKGCLQDLAAMTDSAIPKDLTVVESYRFLVNQVLRRYEEKADLSPRNYERILDSFSSQTCTENRILDSARDEAGRLLRKLHNRLNP
jgi:hypothetical protein